MTKFWKPLLAIALICALALAGLGLAAQSPAAAAQAERADEFRAVWVATVYRLDYPSQATTDPAVLKRDADAILQGCVDMGMNAVILQVRPSADALYPSELYPWSKYLTGAQGTAPKNGFDPLAYWVERAHALGLELHAWVNPFRITKGGAAEFQALTADHPAKLHPDWVVEYEGDYYFNPGLPEVREYIVRGAEELARKYDIDGIHLDDYFYPGSGFADGAAYAKYGKGFSNIGDWRRDNVNQLVKTLGERIHAIDPGLSYGISPSGVWADKSSLPQGSNTTGGYESYYASYADSRKWVKEGWIDYICPQIYWYIGHKSMDYATVARWWADTVKGTGVSLYIGMADYLAGNSDPKSPWYGTTAIERQLALNDTLPQVAGEAHFRYRLMAENPELLALYAEAYGEESQEPAEPAYLNTREHDAYIQGNDGRFRPEDSLSRGGGHAGPPQCRRARESALQRSAWYRRLFRCEAGGLVRPLCGLCQALRHRKWLSRRHLPAGAAGEPGRAGQADRLLFYGGGRYVPVPRCAGRPLGGGGGLFCGGGGLGVGLSGRHLPARRAGEPGGGGQDPQPCPGSPGGGAGRGPALYRRGEGPLGLR